MFSKAQQRFYSLGSRDQSLVVLHILQEILLVILAATLFAGSQFDANVAFVDLLL